VIEFLEAEKARGVSHVFLDESARDGLRDLYRKAQNGGVARPSPAPASAPIAAHKPSAPAPGIQVPTITLENPPAAPPARITAEGSSKQERLDSLRRQAEKWAPARSLGTLRDVMVFAIGNPDARVMLVGEAPGYQEEREREPFVGPAGQKLNDILKAMGLPREEVYISNIVKFRPATPRQTTNNRKPTPEEMASCMPFVRNEVEIIRPECIVALGGTAAEGLLGLDGTVGSMRGKWHQFEGIPVRVTYHPSYLLQSGANLSIKRQLWEDMLEVMAKLAMPISDKQRGFFLPKP
jgi:uracil-DNA glycosylase